MARLSFDGHRFSLAVARCDYHDARNCDMSANSEASARDDHGNEIPAPLTWL
jgi:hypothetical protein